MRGSIRSKKYTQCDVHARAPPLAPADCRRRTGGVGGVFFFDKDSSTVRERAGEQKNTKKLSERDDEPKSRTFCDKYTSVNSAKCTTRSIIRDIVRVSEQNAVNSSFLGQSRRFYPLWNGRRVLFRSPPRGGSESPALASDARYSGKGGSRARSDPHRQIV